MSLPLVLALVSAVSARVPGTSQTVDGMRVVPGVVRVAEDAGLLRTEREDVVENSTPMQLEARYVVHLPKGAALSRVALDVDGTLIEGEVLEAERSRRIFSGIVDRPTPRDPALVERLADGSVQIKIFPVPAHGSRRIMLAYDEVAPAAPTGDAELTLGREGFVLRVPTSALPETLPRARAIAIDASRGQGPRAIARAEAIARELVGTLSNGERFAVLVCDSACASFPSAGLAVKVDASVADLDAWMAAPRGGGARDVAGGVAEAAARVGAEGQIVWLGSGRATSGALNPSDVAARVRTSLGEGAELRAVRVGDVDLGELASLARAVAGTFDDANDAVGSPPHAPAAALARRLHASSLRAPSIDLPAGLALATPLPERIGLGEPLVAIGVVKGAPHGDLTIRGAIQGRSYSSTHQVKVIARDVARADALLAQTRVDALEAKGDAKSLAAAGAIARAHKVLAKSASWLVLESDEMFLENGIARAVRSAPPKQVGPIATTSSAPGVLAGHVARPIALRMAFVQVTGRFPAERIQHIVHMNRARVSFCYEQGLRANPTLAGRVAIKFVIGRDGAVVAAADAGSDLPDAAVVACVADVFRDMAFPTPEGGIVSVVYPFLLTPEAGTVGGPGVLPLRVPASETPDPHTIWQLRTRTEERPDDAEAHDAFVHALMRADRRDEAREAAERFVRAVPGAPRAYDTLIELASPARTATALDARADLSPTDALLHERAARAFEVTGDLRRAASHRLAAAASR